MLSMLQAVKIWVAVIGLLHVFGCSQKGPSKAVDSLIDEYQARVENWEAKVKVGRLSLADLQQLRQESESQAAEVLELVKKDKWTPAQAERYKTLAGRMQQLLLQNMQNRIPGPSR